MRNLAAGLGMCSWLVVLDFALEICPNLIRSTRTLPLVCGCFSVCGVDRDKDQKQTGRNACPTKTKVARVSCLAEQRVGCRHRRSDSARFEVLADRRAMRAAALELEY